MTNKKDCNQGITNKNNNRPGWVGEGEEKGKRVREGEREREKRKSKIHSQR